MTVLTPPSSPSPSLRPPPPPRATTPARGATPLPSLRTGQELPGGVAGASEAGGVAPRSRLGIGLINRPVTSAVTETALITAAFSASIGVARLIEGGLGHAVIVPMAVTVIAGGLVTALCSRRGLPLLVATLLGVIASCLAVLWTVVPGATRFGFPTVTTFHVISNEIHRARAVMGSHRTPVPDVGGVVLIASFSAGIVCVAARALFELSRRNMRGWPRLAALLPTFGMLCYSAPLSARIDRPQITVLYLASALIFVVAADSGGQTLAPSGPYNRVRGALATYLPSAAAGGAALLVSLIAAAALAGTVPLAFPWWNQTPGIGGLPGRGAGHNQVTALSMIANLQGDETASANVQMFEATSPVPTYWQVGLLTVFDEAKGQWSPGPEEAEALDGKAVATPPIPLLPSAETYGTFISSVTIQNFSGRLVPAPPLAILPTVNSPIQTIRIADGIGVSLSSPVTSGKSYQIVAGVSHIPSIASGPSSVADIYAGLQDAGPEYLALPSGIPSQVKAIAEQVVTGARAHTPLEQVQALVNYFRSGSFTYSLYPPPVPKGQNSLIYFLIQSRVGFCQQFAGAFGVLARELGIPVRLAVGFTPGHTVQKGGQEYEVTGSDAHVWPEVYMGASLGWISVDPTPSPANGEQTASGVVNYRPLTGRGQKGRTTTSTSLPNKDKSKLPLPPNPSPSTRTAGHGAHRSAPLPAGLILAGVVLVLAALGGLFAYRRSKRSVRYGGYFARGSSDPDLVVLYAWSRAASALGRAGYRRPMWETPSAHAAAVRAAVMDGATGAKRPDSAAALGAATYGYTELAELAELACYCPGRCTSRDARHAEQEAWRIERALRSSGMFRRFPGPPVAPGTVLTGSLAGSAGRVGGTGSAASGSSGPSGHLRVVRSDSSSTTPR
ncbi:MAG: transglutaminase domain-containing protein [Acidimicrobiales bacterium]